MEDAKKVLSIEAAEWTPKNEAYIKLALATASIDDIKRQDGARLFEVRDQGEPIAAFVLRVDREATRTVGVIVAAGGALSGVDLTAAILPQIEAMFYGCDTIRLHTERAGLVKKLGAQGFALAEIILEKRV
jgi:hypothetical protein